MRAAPATLRHSNQGAFRSTRWSLVLATRDAGTAQGAAALAELCGTYWYPLYLFLRRSGKSAPDAEDLVQSFFQHLLERHAMADADSARGSFRGFLLGRLQHFIVDDWRKGERQKRGGGEAPLSMDNPVVEERVRRELAHDDTPAHLFDRAWAMTLLGQSLDRLAAECDGEGIPGRFAMLKGFLLGARGEMPLDEAARGLNLSLSATKSAVHRLRARYRELLRDEIAQTLAEGEDLDEELRWLIATLSAR